MYRSNGSLMVITCKYSVQKVGKFCARARAEYAFAKLLPPCIAVEFQNVQVGSYATKKLSTRAYDAKVAGVISGANGIDPGLIMRQENSIADGSHPIALAGRVWVWCDASKDSIVPGDQLTTSTRKGMAMRVKDRTRAQGAILGKAMTSLDRGQGYVLVLITLQ